MGIEHPQPTTAIIKALYAHAVNCAFPNCHEPLYREDVETGVWVLNSRVCHICARSEGGPRWNGNQSSKDNRSEANLLLMCISHASKIDDNNLLEHYTESKLRAWKREQLLEHRRLREGWPQTSAMAELARDASFANYVDLSGASVTLGGEGGRAPGAGGGGGGAIGQGARGGRGGNGGRTFDGEGNLLDPPPPFVIPDAFLDEPAPGSGGNGGGASGDFSVGGDGGDGGDRVVTQLKTEEGDIFEVQVGKGGECGQLPGQHSKSGEDTVLVVKAKDGSVRRVIRAGGGRAGRQGTLPDDWLAISLEEVEAGFCISTLMAANYAEQRDGFVYITGGCWSEYNIPSLPFETTWPIIFIASWQTLKALGTRGVQLCVDDPDNNEVCRVLFAIPEDRCDAGSMLWMTSIGAPLDKIGNWKVVVRSDQIQLATISIKVNVIK